MPSRMPSRVPDSLRTALAGVYTLERELGHGGMATVWLALDVRHERRVAIKILHAYFGRSTFATRFLREIGIAASLQHPHILPLHDSGEVDGVPYYVMPYVEGETLRDRLRREGALPIDEALRLTREVGDALAYAHAHNVVHRDVKPENVLLSDGHAIVADFGIARGIDRATGQAALTSTGLVVGTPAYISPEQASGALEIDGRADIYSLGAVLFEMLTGEPPFTGASAQVVVARRFVDEVPSVRAARPAVGEAVDVVVRTALARLPADRFATAEDLVRAIDAAAADPAHGDARLRAPLRPSRTRVGAALAGALVVAVAAIVAVRGRTGRSAAGSAADGDARAGLDGVALAVLPFESVGDTASAIFADGVADEIRGKLASVPSLRVTARTSSNQYRAAVRAPARAPREIARELGVRYLLMGTVQWGSGADGARRVRVSPELVDVTGARAPVIRWRQSFDTTLADVFGVQAAVATAVADTLGAVLDPAARATMARRPTASVAAYAAYLRSSALAGGDPPTVRRALAYAEQAVALDASFAAAWARVATLRANLYANTAPTPAAAAAARTAAERAVALAPDAAEGHIARGYYALLVARDSRSALRALREAVRLAPSSAEARRRLAAARATTGDWSAAAEDFRRAVALDPRSDAPLRGLASALLYLRRYPEARDAATRAVQLAPTRLDAIEWLAMSHLGEGDVAGARRALHGVSPAVDRAALAVFVATFFDLGWALDDADAALLTALPVAAFEGDRGDWGLVHAQRLWRARDTVRARAYADSAAAALAEQVRATPGDWQRRLQLALALAYRGRRADAARDGERAVDAAVRAGDASLIPYARHVLARLYVVTGDRDRAVDQLERVLATAYFVSPAWLRVDPDFAPLRGTPRFARLAADPTTSPR